MLASSQKMRYRAIRYFKISHSGRTSNLADKALPKHGILPGPSPGAALYYASVSILTIHCAKYSKAMKKIL